MTDQQTLTGETAESRDRPKTMLYCPECDEWILRSRRFDHPHDLFDPDEQDDGPVDTGDDVIAPSDDEEDEEDEPRHVADEYTVELIYERRFSVTLPAVDERNAKERAKELHREGESRRSGGHHLHTAVSKGKAIYEDDDEVDDLPGWPW